MMAVSNRNSLYRYKQNIAYKCLIYVFKILQIVFGLQYGFIQFSSKITSVILVMVQSTTICIIQVLNLLHDEQELSLIVWFLLKFVQYLLSSLILACTKKESTFFNLYHDLQIIDLGLKVNHASYHLEVKLLLSILACLLFRCTITLTYCFGLGLCGELNWMSSVYLFVLYTLDTTLVNSAFMFYIINCRLKKLATLVLSDNSNFLTKQHLYKSIVDIAEKHRDAIVPLFLISLLFNIPEVMANIYTSVLNARKNELNYLNIFAQYSTAFQIIIISIMPALCAGMLSTQARTIKIILHNKLLQSEGTQAAQIERFIRYVEARDCCFHACAHLPLDTKLFGTILNFCVTYLIVIIQFKYTS